MSINCIHACISLNLNSLMKSLLCLWFKSVCVLCVSVIPMTTQERVTQIQYEVGHMRETRQSYNYKWLIVLWWSTYTHTDLETTTENCPTHAQYTHTKYPFHTEEKGNNVSYHNPPHSILFVNDMRLWVLICDLWSLSDLSYLFVTGVVSVISQGVY